ncbi:putative CheW protein [Hyella patelloides LEGE 07179]|uniref:Putative CheW protein n=1 Tax=Hyella patelloides LEGE 07179 TaxID=945734 RepID=A0A563VXJ9_9CYAN|nr:chemotaxis protein CheW [Hyella patelloides]VEP16146.1 putative CheW protein [Hyella patelloides LEGE 07179]
MNSNFKNQTHEISTSIKQGNPENIADSLNRYFAPQGIRAKVAWKNAYLGILLEAAQSPNQEEMVEIIRQEFSDCASESVKAVRLYGRQVGQVTPAWCEEITITQSPPSDNHSLSVADWLSQGLKTGSSPAITTSSNKQSELSKFLRFYFSPEDTALLPLKNVKEVLNIPLMGILPVPHMADCLIGIYNYRGEILWLVDLGAQLGFISSTEFIQGINSPAELAIKTTTALTGKTGITLNNDLPTLTVIIVQNEDKHLGIVVPKVVDIEMHDLQEMQYPSEELFSPNILPFLKGYLIRSSSPVLDINSLIEDSKLKLYCHN